MIYDNLAAADCSGSGGADSRLKRLPEVSRDPTVVDDAADPIDALLGYHAPSPHSSL
jgi:hypothetical protein